MQAPSIAPEALEQRNPDSVLLIDLRTEAAYDRDHIPGAISLAREEIPTDSGGRTLVFYCMFGIVSAEMAASYASRGIDACHLEGGYEAYLAHALQQDASDQTRRIEIETSLRKTYRKSLTSKFAKAIDQYELLQPGDRVAVCISGGKDSMLMALLFAEIKRRNKIPFELTYLVMDPGYTESTRRMIEANARLLGIPIQIFHTQIFDAVDRVDESPCYLCARMRRGYLYSEAKKLGCNKIALGHHYDDVIETTLMSILMSGQVQTMMPKLHSTNFEGMELIRPMYLIREADICRFRDAHGLQFIRCACHFTNTCDMEGGDAASKRTEIKRLIAELKKTNENIEGNLFKSMENVHLDAVLGYKQHGEKHSFLDEY